MGYDKAETGTVYVAQAPDTARPDGQPVFSSLEAAFEQVRRLRNEGQQQPLRIQVLDTRYVTDHTIVCPAEVSGVTVEPAQRGSVLSGGVKLHGFRKTTLGGVECLCAPVPEGVEPHDLFVNGERIPVSRYPAQGTLEPEDVEVHNAELFAGSRWFVPRAEDIAALKDTDMTALTVSFCHFWVDEHSPVESYNPRTRRMTLRYQSRFSVYCEKEGDGWAQAHKMRYVFENVPRFHGTNEWYFDRASRQMYYIPAQKTEHPETLEAYIPVVRVLLRVTGTDVTLRGFTFAHTSSDYCSRTATPGGGAHLPVPACGYASDAQAVSGGCGAVEFSHASGGGVLDCAFRHYGVYGVVIDRGCHGIAVCRCRFRDGGAGGVRITGAGVEESPRLHTTGCVVEDNDIAAYGRRLTAGCGILVIHSSGNRLNHNTIHDGYYSGISVGWVWGFGPSSTHHNEIAYNHIYAIGQGRLSDMGGIYLLGTQPGTVVRGNRIHDVVSRDYGGWGIYLDEGSSYILVENNVCYRTTCPPFVQHYGRQNTVRNNIFCAANSPVAESNPRKENEGFLLHGNILLVDAMPLYLSGGDAARTAQVLRGQGNLIWDLRQTPVIHDADGVAWDLPAWQAAFGLETGTVIADPGFADPNCGDFRFTDDSAAKAIGFIPWDTASSGCRL